jgi:hypothetical protein
MRRFLPGAAFSFGRWSPSIGWHRPPHDGLVAPMVGADGVGWES